MTAERLTIRPLAAHEWRTWRALRLAALSDAPDAYGPTLAEAAAQTETDWQERAQRLAGPDRRLFVLDWDGEPSGMVSATTSEGGAGHLGAMWLHPALRGRGAGGRLWDTASNWLVAQGCRTLLLWVTETNATARAMYEQRGFVLTGVSQPLREGSPLRSLEMRREVTP